MSRVKMPHNNRMSSSTALRTNDIWSKTIGYDPYANSNESQKEDESAAQAASLMLLARMSNLSGTESRGGCKRCGMLGHLSFQCRNAPLKQAVQAPSSDSDSDSDSDSSSSSSSSSSESRPGKAGGEYERTASQAATHDDKSDRKRHRSSKSEEKRKKRRKDSHKDHKKKDKKDKKDRKERKKSSHPSKDSKRDKKSK